MRILVVNNRYPPFMTGGYELSAALAVDGLRARGHEVRVLTSTHGASAPGRENEVRRCLRGIHDSSDPRRLVWLEWEDALTLEDEVRSFRPDLLSAWNLLGLFPAVLRGLANGAVPAVFHLHDLYLDGIAAWAKDWQAFWSRPAGSPLRSLPKRAVAALALSWGAATGWPRSAADVPIGHAVFCSDFIRRRHEAAGVRAGDWRVILSGVDLERFSPRDRPGASGGLRLLFVGRLHPSKGAHLALGAMERLVAAGRQDVSLTILGAIPPDRGYFDDLVRRGGAPALRGRVCFPGFVPNDEMPDVYRAHDALVFPTSHLEGLPRAAMEAMACGRAVVGTSAGGGAELFEDGVNAVLVPQDDEEALAQRLGDLAGQPERIHELGSAARRHVVARHSVGRTQEAIEAYYREVLTTDRRAA